MGEASSPKGFAYLQLLQEARGRHGASAIDAFVRVACLAQGAVPNGRGSVRRAQERKSKRICDWNMVRRRVKEGEKKKKKKVPYKVAVSRIKLGLLNDFEPRPAVAPLGWGKKWGPGFYRMKA